MSDSLEQTLSRDGFLIRTVHGNSMLPLLEQSKDLVRIVPAVHPLAVGDLPLYKRPDGTYVLHRVISVRKDCYVVCGDNRSFSEDVPCAWVVGVAEGFYKNGVYTPCSDPAYRKYALSHARHRRPRAFLLRFRLFRGLRKLKNRLFHRK